jgi:nucleoside-diphosphate-sugar epimerase
MNKPIITIFGCGGYLSTAVLESLALEGYSLRPFSTSRNAVKIQGKHHKVQSYSPQRCPLHLAHDSDLIINLCTEGVSHKQTHGAKTLIANIEIATACANLAANSRGKRLLHVGSYHEDKLAPYCKVITQSILLCRPALIDSVDTYGLSKSLQTITLANLSEILNISTLVVLTPNIYGPPNPPNSLASHLDDVAQKHYTKRLQNPHKKITTIHISDFASAISSRSNNFISNSRLAKCVIDSIPGTSSSIEVFAESYLRRLRHP